MFRRLSKATNSLLTHHKKFTISELKRFENNFLNASSISYIESLY
jgi:hypothetical protein